MSARRGSTFFLAVALERFKLRLRHVVQRLERLSGTAPLRMAVGQRLLRHGVAALVVGGGVSHNGENVVQRLFCLAGPLSCGALCRRPRSLVWNAAGAASLRCSYQSSH